MNGKWSCCDHRSKHSQGCTPSFCGTHPRPPSSQNSSCVPSNKSSTTSSIARGPLPPTPAGSVAPTPPPHSSQYLQNHGQIPDSIQSYEHNTLKSTARDPSHREDALGGRGGGMVEQRMGSGGRGSGGGASLGLANNRPAKQFVPPLPVSVRLL